MASQFELVVRNTTGAVKLVTVAAQDAASARAIADRDGVHVLHCRQRQSNNWFRISAHTSQQSVLDVADLWFELSSLMSAGLSVADALRTLASKEQIAQRRLALLDITKGINEGLPLSAALGRHPGRFPPLLIATVQASEQTGDLSDSLLRYANHQLLVKSLKDKVIAAAIYPVLLLTVGCLVIIFLVTVVVPKFATLIASSGHALPWSSRVLMAWGRFAAQHGWQLLMLGALLIAAATVMAGRVSRNGARAAWLDKIPLLGPTMRQFRRAQLYRTVGMLVRGGIALPAALQMGSSFLGDADRQRLHTAIRMIYEGRSLSAALQGAQLSDPVAISLLAVAERTGTMADILERIALFHDASLQRSVQLGSRLIEPVLMVVIGLVVGAIVVLMYMPIFDLAASLQ